MDEQLKKEIRQAVEDAFSASVSDKRYIDVSRIPLICQSVVEIHSSLNKINSDMWWIKYLGAGFLAAAGLLALKALGA